MNILHVIDTTGPGGAETVFVELAKLSREAGHNVVTTVRGSGWVADQLSANELDVRVIPCKGSFNLGYLVALVRLIRSEKIDVIQSHLLGSNVYTSIAGKVTGVPVVSTFHGHVDISPNERFKWLKLKAIQLGSSQVVAVTVPLADAIKSIESGMLKSKVKVIPNGISLDGFDLNRSVQSGFSNPLKICCLGNVRVAKNYMLALEVIKYLVDQSIDVKLDIAGDDSNKLAADLKLSLDSLGLSGIVRFIGFVRDVPDFLQQYELFLMSSSSEGHPLALTQALASGLPIVTTPSGVEAVVGSDTLFISEEHTAASIGSLILDVLSIEQSELSTRVNRGRNLAVATFSNKAMYQRYEEVYLNVIH
ncbi:glycosyltransferase family 4 protein [Reinekea sp. G2M2-21]|uniref:glycosyltransferase family 4 protein n=1 Tax=Reinekea sp. G2M2-21 TaxID=2788942 RepID=UPI0018AC2904|nr:glycosyltransferase family 4 protein [Reinekea sp. G2M2-21]